jgi:hypothetical protein
LGLALQDSLGGLPLGGDEDEDEAEMDEAADVQFNVTVTKVRCVTAGVQQLLAVGVLPVGLQICSADAVWQSCMVCWLCFACQWHLCCPNVCFSSAV